MIFFEDECFAYDERMTDYGPEDDIDYDDFDPEEYTDDGESVAESWLLSGGYTDEDIDELTEAARARDEEEETEMDAWFLSNERDEVLAEIAIATERAAEEEDWENDLGSIAEEEATSDFDELFFYLDENEVW